MPGTTTDTVPTMLTPGEFVIKRESAKMLGKPFLEKLNAVSDNSAHDNIDALISQAALAQMQPMMGGGVVNEYMGGGDVSNYMGGGDVMNYMYGGGIKDKKKKKMAGYQEGGAVDNTLTAEDLAFMNMSEDVPSVKSYLNPEIVFGKDYKNMSAEKLNKSAKNFRDLMHLFKNIATEDSFFDFSPLAPGLGGSNFNMNDASSLDDLVYLLSDEEGMGSDAFKRLMKAQSSDDPALVKNFNGYQDGGVVSDNTATSAMDALIAQSEISQALKENPQSNYSMVDADIVDAENRELIEMIMNMAMPGSGVVGSVKKVTGKLPELAKKFASMSPDKGKQKVLDKIAKEMTLAPSRKVMQNPSRNLYDYKDYKVLENTLNKPFNAMDLINEGYLQKYTNKLIKNMKPSGDVKLKDIVDSKYYNINEATKDVLGLPKKERMKAAKDLLKSFNINLKKVKGKQDGGAVGNSFIPLDQRDSSSVATGKWGEFGDYNEHLKQLINLIELDSLLSSGEAESIERKPEFDNFLYNDFNNPRMSPADSSNARNLLEWFNSQLMQGRDSSDIQRGIN